MPGSAQGCSQVQSGGANEIAMAETKGSGRLDDREECLGKREAARKEREDALIVMTHLESKSAARVTEHAKRSLGSCE
jgi:hypothetical protein